MGAFAMRAGIFLALCPCASGLNPALDISQYAHTSWTVRSGFFEGNVESIAQTPDGYLWLGTGLGLLRFDGIRPLPWTPPAGDHLPGNAVGLTLVTRDGRLWIGTRTGLASWKDGKLTHYPEFAGQAIGALMEDNQGAVWVGTIGTTFGKLCAIRNATVQCEGGDGAFGVGVISLFEHKGDLWVGSLPGLWHWKPGPPKLYPKLDASREIRSMIAGDNGALWLATRGGLMELAPGEVGPHPIAAIKSTSPRSMLRDRDGSLWISEQFHGLLHLHQGRIDAFGATDGLSGDSVSGLFEDREGDIWVATQDGLDRFRDLAIPTLTTKQGLSSVPAGSVLASKDGSLWLGTSYGLNHWSNGRITVYGKSNGLPDEAVTSLFEENRRRIWVGTLGGLAYLQNGRFVALRSVPSHMVHNFAEDKPGSIWVNDQQEGLLHLVDGKMVERFPWNTIWHDDYATAMAPDRQRGGLWLGSYQGNVVYFENGQIRSSYGTAEGFAGQMVTSIRQDQDGTLWVLSEGVGLSRVKDGHVDTLTSRNGLPCDGIHWMTEDDQHARWLNTRCGLVRIDPAEWDAWSADPKHVVRTTVFDISDGVRKSTLPGGYTPRAAKSSDGRIWFWGLDGDGIIDPPRIVTNKLPPPVQIEQITADRKTYWQNMSGDPASSIKLPPLVRDLQIDYTALSLAAPEKTQFKYKLEGEDRDWQEVGNRRQAFYTNLAPRKYRFHVAAANNSGVWNETGAFLDFSIAPAYYQTAWFSASLAGAFLVLLVAVYQLRLRYLNQQFNVRMEERINERTRIARDLHDTLLQSFQGLLLKFYAVKYMLPDRPLEAGDKLEAVIEQARLAIAEGRDAVQGLRTSALATNDLAEAIKTLGEELCSSHAGPNPPTFGVEVEGAPRDLAPILRDELYSIAAEALRNACLHAQAKRLEVEIRYGQRQLRMRVRDDGVGIDPAVMKREGRAGHFGLPGMHERAKLVGGKLSIWSQLHSGTEIELIIPAAIAYAKQPAATVSSWKGTS